ncbi:MAG: hypothetical protein IPK10_17930 [Bacteroidetes bacterium]|nr:hypothetical protein [Bacteroidota bacterium]
MNTHKYFVWIIPFLLFVSNADGQKKPTLLNSSLTKPEKAVVYIGVDNVISLYGDVPGKYIRMERSGGPLNIRPGMKLRTVLKYTETGFDTIRVFDNDKLIIEKIYEIKRLGAFGIGVKEMRDSLLTKEEFLKAESLELYMPNGFYRPKQKISSYNITLLSSMGKVIQKIKVDGINYSEVLKIHLDKIQPGISIQFSDVKANVGENKMLNFDPINIKIK